MAGAQGTRKTKKKTSDTLEGYIPPPTTTTTPTETSWVSPPASLNTTPFTASSKKPTSVFTTPTTYTTPSQPTFSTNSFNPSLYSTNIYSQLASVDSLATADAKTIQNQKFLRGQAATQARTELQQAKLEAAETQQIPDRLSEPRTIVSDFDRTRGQQTKGWTLEDPLQDRIDATNMGGFWGGDPLVQKAPTSDLEMQLNLALSSVRIDDSQKRIDDYQTQMAKLQHTMESEEAKMRTKPQRRGFSGYSESFFMNESALWRDAKHEKDELEKIIGKEKTHLATEINKKEDWENVSLTDVTGAAFTGGVEVGVGAPNPMEGAFDEITPTTLGTTTWVDKEPDITEVLQSPKVKTGKATSVFQGLELPQHDFLGGLGFNAINPLPALFGATVPVSEVEKFREAEQAGGAGLWQTAYAEDETVGPTTIEEPTTVSWTNKTRGVDVKKWFGDEGLSDSETSFKESRTYVTDDMGTPDDPSDDVHRMMGTPHLEGSIRDGIIGSIDDRPRIQGRYGVVDNPDYMKFIYPVPSKEEAEKNSAEGKVWDRLTGWQEDVYVYKDTFPDQTKLNPDGSKGTKAPDGYEWNQPFWDEKNANAPVMYNPQGEDIKGVFTVDQYGKEMYVYPTKGSTSHTYTMGTPDDTSDDVTVRIPQNLSEEERQIISKGYQQQAENRRLNELQKAKFDAIRDGSISVQSFINMSTGGDKKLTQKYFEERGVSLTDSMASVKLVDDGLEPVKGIDVAAKWGIVDKTGLQSSGLMQAVLLEYNNERGKIQMDTTPEAQTYFIMPSDPIQSDHPELDTRYQGVEKEFMIDTRETIVDERKQVGTLAGGVLDLNEKIKNPNFAKIIDGKLDTRKQIDNPNYNLWIDNPAYGTFIDNPTFDQQVPNPNAGQTMKEVEPLYAVGKDELLDTIKELTEDGRLDGGWYLHPSRDDPSVDMSVFHTDEELKDLKERGVDVSSYQQTKPNEENYVSPEGFSPASVEKMWTLKEELAESYGEAGSPAAIYLQPTTMLEVYNKRTGTSYAFDNSTGAKKVEGSTLTFSTTTDDADNTIEAFDNMNMENPNAQALWAQIREREHGTASDDDWAKWQVSKPEETSESWGDFMGFAPTDFPSPDDYEVRKTTGYEWTHEGIVHLESEGLIETKLEQKLRQADIQAQKRIDDPELFSVEPIDERSVIHPWKTGEVTSPSTPQIPDDALLEVQSTKWGEDGIPFLPVAFAESDITTTPDGGTLPVKLYPWSAVGLGGTGVVVGRSDVVSESAPEISGEGVIESPTTLSLTTVFEPTPEKKREGEYKVFTNNPVEYVFDREPAWTQKYYDAKADGTLPPNMSYSDLVDRDFAIRVDIVDEQRYFMSADLDVFGNIIKAGAQVAGSEEHPISELTFVEGGIDALSKHVQWHYGQRVEDIDAKGGEIDPMTGELTKGFDERLGRPIHESASIMSAGLEDEAQHYGSKYEAVQDPDTGAWSNKLIGEESKGFLHAPEWYNETTREDLTKLGAMNIMGGVVGGTGIAAGKLGEDYAKDQISFRALPWGTIAEIPAEAAFFAMSLPLKGPLIATMKIAPYISSKLAKVVLQQGIIKKAEAAAKLEVRAQSLPTESQFKALDEAVPHGITPPKKLLDDTRPLTAADRAEFKDLSVKAALIERFTGLHINAPGRLGFEQVKASTTQTLKQQAKQTTGAPGKDITDEVITQTTEQAYKKTVDDVLFDLPLTQGQKAVQSLARAAGLTPQKYIAKLSGVIHPNLGIRSGIVYRASPIFLAMRGFVKSSPQWMQDTRIGRRMQSVGTHAEIDVAYHILEASGGAQGQYVATKTGKKRTVDEIKKMMTPEDEDLITRIKFDMPADPKAAKDIIAKKLFGEMQAKRLSGGRLTQVEVNYDTLGIGKPRSERKSMQAEVDRQYEENLKKAGIPPIPEHIEGERFALPPGLKGSESIIPERKGIPFGTGYVGGERMVYDDFTRIAKEFGDEEFSSIASAFTSDELIVRTPLKTLYESGDSPLGRIFTGYADETGQALVPKSWAGLVKSPAYTEAEKLVKAGKVVWDDVGGYTVLSGKKISPTSQAAIEKATGLRKKATMIGETAEERAKYRLVGGDTTDPAKYGILEAPSGVPAGMFEPVAFSSDVYFGAFTGKQVTRETLEASMGRTRWGEQLKGPQSPQMDQAEWISREMTRVEKEMKMLEGGNVIRKIIDKPTSERLSDERGVLMEQWVDLMRRRGYTGIVEVGLTGTVTSKKIGSKHVVDMNLKLADRPYTKEEIAESVKLAETEFLKAKALDKDAIYADYALDVLKEGDIKTGKTLTPFTLVKRKGRGIDIQAIQDRPYDPLKFGHEMQDTVTMSRQEVMQLKRVLRETEGEKGKGIYDDVGEGDVWWYGTAASETLRGILRDQGLSTTDEKVYFRITHPRVQHKPMGEQPLPVTKYKDIGGKTVTTEKLDPVIRPEVMSTGKKYGTEPTDKQLANALDSDRFVVDVFYAKSDALKGVTGEDFAELIQIHQGKILKQFKDQSGEISEGFNPIRMPKKSTTKMGDQAFMDETLAKGIAAYGRFGEQGVKDRMTFFQTDGYDMHGGRYIREGVIVKADGTKVATSSLPFTLRQLEKENEIKMQHLDVLWNNKHTGVKVEKRALGLYEDKRQIFSVNAGSKAGLVQYNLEYLQNTKRAKEIWDAIGAEKMNKLGFKMNSVGHIVLKADPTQKEGVIAKKIEKLLDTHRYITQQERDAPRAYLAKISKELGDEFATNTYTLTSAQNNYLKKKNLIVSFSEIGTIHGGKGERRVLTEYFGDARGSIEKSSKGPKFKSSSTTIDGFKKSSNVDLVFGNLYQEVKTAKNRFKQPHWGKAQDIRGKDSFNLDGVTRMELDAFLTVKNKKVMDAFESRYPLFNKNADTEMIQNRIRERYGMVLDTDLTIAKTNFNEIDFEFQNMKKLGPILAEMDKDMPRIWSSLLAVSKWQHTRRIKGQVSDRDRSHEIWKWNEEAAEKAKELVKLETRNIKWAKQKIEDAKVLRMGRKYEPSPPKKGEAPSPQRQAWLDARQELSDATSRHLDAVKTQNKHEAIAKKEQKNYEKAQAAGVAGRDPSAIVDESLGSLDAWKLKYTFDEDVLVDGAPKVTSLSWEVNTGVITTRRNEFWKKKGFAGTYDDAKARREELLQHKTLNQIFPTEKEIKEADLVKEFAELTKLRTQITATENVSMFNNRNLAGSPLGEQSTYAIKKYETQQMAMKTYFSLFGKKYSYQIAVKKGGKYSWVDLQGGSQANIIKKAQKYGVSLSNDDVAFAKELDTLPTGSQSLKPSEANKIKRMTISTGDFDPRNVRGGATPPTGVLTVTRGGIERQVRDPFSQASQFTFGGKGAINYIPPGIARDLDLMMKFNAPMSSKVAGRIIDARSLGKAELGIFSAKSEKAARLFGIVQEGSSLKAGQVRDKDRLIIELQEHQRIIGGNITDLEKAITAKASKIQDIDESANLIKIDELSGDGPKLRRKLFNLEVQKDAAWGDEKTTTKMFDTSDSGFVGVDYSSPNFKRIAAIQQQIEVVKTTMRSKKFSVPDYTTHMDEFWKAHFKIQKNETLTASEKAARAKGLPENLNEKTDAKAFKKMIENKDVNNYLAGERRMAEDAKAVLEKKYFDYKTGRSVIDDALNDDAAKKHIYDLHEWNPTLEKRATDHAKKLEKAEEKVTKIREKIRENEALIKADQRAAEVEKKVLDSGSFMQRVNLQGSEMGRLIIISADDAVNDPQMLRQFMQGKDWGAKDLLKKYTKINLFNPQFGYRTYRPVEGLSMSHLKMPDDEMLSGAQGLRTGGIVERIITEKLRKKAFDAPLPELTGQMARKGSREEAWRLAVRSGQALPEIADEQMGKIIYQIYRSKVPLHPTRRAVEGQFRPITRGVKEIYLKMTGQPYFKQKTAGKGKEKHYVEGDYYTGKGEQYYERSSAAQVGVTKYHIRKIESEMGFSLEGQSQKVIRLLEEGALKGKKQGDTLGVDSSKWKKLTPTEQKAYEQTGIYPTGSWQRIWTDAIEQRSYGDQMRKWMNNSQVVKRDGDVFDFGWDDAVKDPAGKIIRPAGPTTPPTRIVSGKMKVQQAKDWFASGNLRKMFGEKLQTVDEATSDLMSKFKEFKIAENQKAKTRDEVAKAENILWNMGQRDTKYTKTTQSLTKVIEGKKTFFPKRDPFPIGSKKKVRGKEIDVSGKYLNPFKDAVDETTNLPLGKYITRGQLERELAKQRNILLHHSAREENLKFVFERTRHGQGGANAYSDFLIETWKLNDADKIKYFGSSKDAAKWIDGEFKKAGHTKDKEFMPPKKEPAEESGSAQKTVESLEDQKKRADEYTKKQQKESADARAQVEQTIDQMNQGQFGEFFQPVYELARYPAGTILPFRVPQQQEQFNPFTTQAVDTTSTVPTVVEPPTVTPPQTMPDLSVYGGLDPFKSTSPSFDPPDLTYSQGVTPIPMPDIMSGMNIGTRAIQSDMSSLGIVSRVDQTVASRLIQTQAVAQKLTQVTRQKMVQKTRQKLRMRPLVSSTKPFVPRTIPQPPMMPLLFPPFDALRPRRRPKKKIKKDKTRIWWDVPSQPLGEAWAANEYVVFKGKVEPAKVQKKERKKKLDYHETFVEPQEYTESFYSDKGAKNFGG